MNLSIIFIISAFILFLGYIFYGKKLTKIYEINDKNPTPANTMKDDVDFVPTEKSILLGHHFSSIAGAGPIIGPISGALFGWLPALLWIIIGSIFVGGVHDFSALISSIRNKAVSVGELIQNFVGKRGRFLFLSFSWLSLVLVIAVFAEITKNTFIQDPGISTTAISYIFLAILFARGTPLFWMPIKTRLLGFLFLSKSS